MIGVTTLVALLLTSVVAPIQVFAQDETSQSAGCNPGAANLNLADCLYLNNETGATVGDTYGTPADLINTVVRALFPISGLILFGIIIYAGFLFINKGAEAKSEARQIIQAAVIGFIIMIAAYWIVQIIGLATGIENLGIL